MTSLDTLLYNAPKAQAQTAQIYIRKAVMAGKQLIGLREYGTEGKVSNVSIQVVDIDSANLDAQLTAFGVMRSAIEAVTLGNIVEYALVAEAVDTGAGIPTDKNAQRENKWLVTMRGQTSGKVYQRSIPTADLSLLSTNGVDMETGTPRTNLVLAFQIQFKGDGGEAVTVESIKYVS